MRSFADTFTGRSVPSACGAGAGTGPPPPRPCPRSGRHRRRGGRPLAPRSPRRLPAGCPVTHVGATAPHGSPGPRRGRASGRSLAVPASRITARAASSASWSGSAVSTQISSLRPGLLPQRVDALGDWTARLAEEHHVGRVLLHQLQQPAPVLSRVLSRRGAEPHVPDQYCGGPHYRDRNFTVGRQSLKEKDEV